MKVVKLARSSQALGGGGGARAVEEALAAARIQAWVERCRQGRAVPYKVHRKMVRLGSRVVERLRNAKKYRRFL